MSSTEPCTYLCHSTAACQAQYRPGLVHIASRHHSCLNTREVQAASRPEMAEIQPFDSLLKVLLVGDSSVGKSSLLLRFTADQFVSSTNPTIGVDFRTKYVTMQNKKLKLTIWDTAGQERFRTLTSSYYRGAHAVIFVYDVTRRETFDSLGEIWMQEVDMYSTIDNAIKMVVANKVDRESDREVTTEEGQNFGKAHGCLFVETSAKADVAVTQAFEELVLKVLETPQLLTDAGNARLHIGAGARASGGGCCS